MTIGKNETSVKLGMNLQHLRTADLRKGLITALWYHFNREFIIQSFIVFRVVEHINHLFRII